MTASTPLTDRKSVVATSSLPPGAIYVIGDSHIGLKEGSDRKVVEWIDRLVKLRPRALYLNGDLFHYLIAHPTFVTTSVEKVFERFRALRDSGVAVHYVEGNRDFFLKGSFVEESVTDVGLEYDIAAGDRRYLVVHGDMINERDYAYRFWRRLSKNPVSKVAINFIPKKTARKFVDDVEKKLSKSNFKHKNRLPIALLEKFGSTRGERGYTDVVFGHFHEKVVMPAGRATVTILPPWYESGEAMVIDPGSGEARFAVI